MALVDTDVMIDLLRAHPTAQTWLSGLAETPDVPGFVALELYQGCRDKVAVREVDELLSTFLVVWPSPVDANQALSYFPHLKLSHGLGLLDCLIACCAVERSTTLYSFNLKHFSAYPGLTAEAPYQKP